MASIKFNKIYEIGPYKGQFKDLKVHKEELKDQLILFVSALGILGWFLPDQEYILLPESGGLIFQPKPNPGNNPPIPPAANAPEAEFIAYMNRLKVYEIRLDMFLKEKSKFFQGIQEIYNFFPADCKAKIDALGPLVLLDGQQVWTVVNNWLSDIGVSQLVTIDLLLKIKFGHGESVAEHVQRHRQLHRAQASIGPQQAFSEFVKYKYFTESFSDYDRFMEMIQLFENDNSLIVHQLFEDTLEVPAIVGPPAVPLIPFRRGIATHMEEKAATINWSTIPIPNGMETAGNFTATAATITTMDSNHNNNTKRKGSSRNLSAQQIRVIPSKMAGKLYCFTHGWTNHNSEKCNFPNSSHVAAKRMIPNFNELPVEIQINFTNSN